MNEVEIWGRTNKQKDQDIEALVRELGLKKYSLKYIAFSLFSTTSSLHVGTYENRLFFFK